MHFRKNLTLFVIGGGAYVGLELMYRRRSHISMFAAGGTCFLLLGRLGKSRLHSGLKLFLGGGIITGVELLFGLVFNRRYTVWDYRSLPGNYRGQICPAFAAAWIPLSGAAMTIYSRLEAYLADIGT